MAGFGVYVGAGGVPDLLQFEAWAGRQVEYIHVFSGKANWSDWQTSIGWAANLWATASPPRKLKWTVPLFATIGNVETSEGNLADAAAGTYNSRYVTGAQTLANARPNDPEIIVRTGEEFNGGWMPWSSRGREAQYVQAFRHFVNSFRSVSNRFRFEWNPNIGYYGSDAELAYPGDTFVDVISMDFYYDTQFYTTDPLVAWNRMLTERNGLNWLKDFALAHGKKMAISEWGVNSNTAGPFIELAAKWFADNNVLFQVYWNSNSNFQGKLSDNQYPATGAAYINAFRETAVLQPSSGALIYSPRTSWDLTINLATNDIRTFDSAIYAGKHIRIIGKTAIDTARGLLFKDVASVTIIGGHFQPSALPVYGVGAPAAGAMTFDNVGAVYLEGVVLDNVNIFGLVGGDGIHVAARSAATTVTIQNSHIRNVRGLESNASAQGDMIDFGAAGAGKVGAVRIHNSTFSGDYRGIVSEPRSGAGVTSLTLSRVNLHRTTQAAPIPRLLQLYTHSAEYDSSGYPIILSDVWADGGTGQTVADTILPSTTAGTGNQFATSKYRAVVSADGRGTYAFWPELQVAGKEITDGAGGTGKVYQGKPPSSATGGSTTGDFAPVARIGVSYVQGSDLSLPAGTTPVTPADPPEDPDPVIPPVVTPPVDQTPIPPITMAAIRAKFQPGVPRGITVQKLHELLDEIENRSSQQVLVKTASYTATLADNRRTIVFNAAAAISLTLPNNIPQGFNLVIAQVGAGSVSVGVVGGAVRSRANHGRTAGQYATAYLICFQNLGLTPEVLMVGDTAP